MKMWFSRKMIVCFDSGVDDYVNSCLCSFVSVTSDFFFFKLLDWPFSHTKVEIGQTIEAIWELSKGKGCGRDILGDCLWRWNSKWRITERDFTMSIWLEVIFSSDQITDWSTSERPLRSARWKTNKLSFRFDVASNSLLVPRSNLH